MFSRLHRDSELSAYDPVDRDWGRYVVLHTVSDENEVVIHKEKLLIIKPATSLQLHKHLNYTELWIGESSFTYVLENSDGELIEYSAESFERVFIPKGRKHGITSLGDVYLRILEIQAGIIYDDDNIKF